MIAFRFTPDERRIFAKRDVPPVSAWAARHLIVQDGPYRFVRHPLYASLLWMFLGASAAYLNWLAALETLLVFLPAMTYRAALEERALEGRFGEAYAAYRARTPRFFPRPSALFRAGDR